MGKGGPALRAVLSAITELLGVAAIFAGFWWIAPWLGLIVGGIAMIIIGVAIDPPPKRPTREQADAL